MQQRHTNSNDNASIKPNASPRISTAIAIADKGTKAMCTPAATAEIFDRPA
nr:hypothetical protein [Verminephrobacter aporrectodeae]